MFKRLFVDESPDSDGESKASHAKLAYTDHIFKPAWLNRFLLQSNMIYGHLYRNCINAPFMSHKTQAVRRQWEAEQQKLKADHCASDNCSPPEVVTGTQNNKTQQAFAENDQLELRVPHKTQWVYTYTMCYEIFLIIRFILITGYLSDKFPKQTLVTASQPSGSLKYEARAHIRPIDLMREAPQLLKQPEGSQSELETTTINSFPMKSLQMYCLNELQDYLNEHFGRFYLWEASVGLDRRNASSILFNNDDYRFKTILEESYAMQISGKEIKVYTYLIACFLVTCFAGSLIAGKIPYDITPLMLIYDPQVVAYTIRLRVCRYLDHMRQSYANFWSSYSLGDENELVFKGYNQHDDLDDLYEYGVYEDVESDHCSDDCESNDSNDTNDFVHETGLESVRSGSTIIASLTSIGNNFDTLRHRGRSGTLKFNIDLAPIVKSNITNKSERIAPSNRVQAPASRLLSCKNFHNYLPRVRSQSWRRVLMILHPSSHQASILFTIGSLLSLWYLFVLVHSDSAANNKQFKMFLQNKGERGEGQPFELSQFSDLSHRCHNLLNNSLDLNRVRALLVQNYAQSLRKHDERTYALKSASYLNSSFGFEATMTGELPLPQDAIDLEIVANTMAPLQMPHPHFWIIPTICAIMPCLLAALYLVVLATTFLDLGIWLIELRMKLYICIDLLKHYQNSAQTIKLPNASQVGGGRGSLKLAPRLAMGPTPSAIANQANAIACLPLRPRFSLQSSQLVNARPFKVAAESGERAPVRRGYLPSSPAPIFRPPEEEHEEPPLANSLETEAGNGDDLCNVKLGQILAYIMANRRGKDHIIELYARQLICLDQLDSMRQRKNTRKFLVSTYLDFRLFLDQIDDCRNSVNFLIGYTVLHALNIIAASITLTGIFIQVGFVMSAFGLANLSLIGGGFFQSQCKKLYAPINSILALCLKGDKVVLHLASLWRRALVDLCGSRTKLSFRVYSLNISYALALQFNLSIVSLYIIIIDRSRLDH